MTIRKVGFVFPGQGSQSVGMLDNIASQYAEVKQTFDQASAELGFDLWEMVSNGTVGELDNTVNTQPALLTAEVALYRIIQNKTDQRPALLAGHSLGEYAALVCANALSFQDAVKLVALRGEYMQAAVPAGTGAMAAIIGLDDDAIAALCDEVKKEGEVLTPANFNTVGQVVIAGSKEAVERATKAAKPKGAKMAVIIPVSVPSHCALMQPAAEKLKVKLAEIEINKPVLPVVSNVDVAVYDSADSIRDGLVRQLYSPVRWVETMQYFIAQDVTRILECGPGKVLSGLNKRIDKQLELYNSATLNHFQAFLETMAA